ncbi:MAG: thermonuclease family protein, partial [Alphaproteobacteria bacterium]
PNGSEPLADEARALLAGAVLGKPVTLLYGGLKRDRYERALAHVRVDAGRRWMQGEILAAGLARVRTYPDSRAMAAEMLEAEAEARRAGKGLWALDAYKVLLPYECPGKSGFQIIEGKVSKVAVGGGAVLLDFLSGGARAEIPRFVSADFAAAGHALEGLKDRLVRIRGPLRDGVIRLDHPETLELLRN